MRFSVLSLLALYGLCLVLGLAYFNHLTRAPRRTQGQLSWAQAVQKWGKKSQNDEPKKKFQSGALLYAEAEAKRETESRQLIKALLKDSQGRDRQLDASGQGDPVRMFCDAGKYNEAEKLLEKVLDALTDYWRDLPAESLSHPDKVIAAADEGDLLFRLSSILAREGKWQEASELLDRANVFQKHRRGKTAFTRAEELSFAGWVDAHLGKEKAASESFAQALDIRKKAFGEYDLLTAWSKDEIQWLNSRRARTTGNSSSTGGANQQEKILKDDSLKIIQKTQLTKDSRALVQDYARFLKDIGQKQKAELLEQRQNAVAD